MMWIFNKALSEKILQLEQSIQYKVNNKWYHEGTGFVFEQVERVDIMENRIFLIMEGDYIFPIFMPKINDRHDGITLQETRETLKVLNEIEKDKINLFMYSKINLSD